MRKSTAQDFWDRVRSGSSEECWEWQAASTRSGYGQLRFQGRWWAAHRLAYSLHFGNFPADCLVCHQCDNRKCCNPAHLFLGTHLDNVRDKIAKGRGAGAPGERNGNAKLTVTQIEEIRAAIERGESKKSQALKYGINRLTVSTIVKRLTWNY